MESITPNIPSKTEESKGEILNSNANESSRDITVLQKIKELQQKQLKQMLDQKEEKTEANIEKIYQTQTIHLANQRGNQGNEEHKRDEEGQLIASITDLNIKIKLLQELQDDGIDPLCQDVEAVLNKRIKNTEDFINESKGKIKLGQEARLKDLQSQLDQFTQLFQQSADLDSLREQVRIGLEQFDIPLAREVNSELVSLKKRLANTQSPKDQNNLSALIVLLEVQLKQINVLIIELNKKLTNDLKEEGISLEELPEMYSKAQKYQQIAEGNKATQVANQNFSRIDSLIKLQKELIDLVQPEIPIQPLIVPIQPLIVAPRFQDIPSDVKVSIPNIIKPNNKIEELKDNQQTQNNLLYEIEIQNMKYSKKMPECFERSVITICYYLYLVAFKRNDEIFNNKNNEFADKIKQEALKLHNFYKKELYNNAQIIQVIDDVNLTTSRGILSESIADQILKKLSKIILIIRPFFFQDFFDLIRETNDSAALIKGKKIILMLGSTGCGKSTTIQYLCGSMMEEIKTKEGLFHIQASNITNTELERIITKPNAQSVTRFVTPVNISFQSGRKIVSLLLVDTPGTGDRQSTEIDVSNGIGIINAIKPSDSVHPVIILSYLDILSHRGQGLIDQLKYYASMFNNLEDNVKSFNYLFSHVPERIKLEDLKNKIVDIQDLLYHNDKNDQSLNLILDNIIDKLMNNESAALLRPLDKNHSVILNKIYSNQSIKNPISAFKQNISQKSSDILKTQLSIHDKSIVTAISSENIILAIWKLNEFQQMVQIIESEQFCNSAFNACIQKIQEILINDTDRAIKHIIRCLSPSNSITKEDVNEFKKIFTTTKIFEQIRDKFLDKSITKSSGDLIASVYSSLNQTIEKIKALDITHQHWQECFEKFIFLKENFTEFKEIEYQLIENYKFKLTSLKEDSIKILKKIFKKNSKNDQNLELLQSENNNSSEVEIQDGNAQDEHKLNYTKYSALYKQLIDARILINSKAEIHTFLGEAVFQLEKQLIMALEKHQKTYFTIILEDNPNPILTVENIEETIILVDIIDNIINSFQNVSKRVVEQIKPVSGRIFDTLQKIFNEKQDKLQVKFNQISKNTNESGTINNDFEQLNLLRNIKGIREVTNIQFFSLKNDIENLVRDKKIEIQMMIQQNQFDDFYQLKKLKGALSCIQNLNGINGSSQNFIESTKTDIKDTFDEVLDLLQQKLNPLIVNADHPSNIAVVADIYLNVQEIYKIAQIHHIQLDQQEVGTSKIKEIDAQLLVIQNFAQTLAGRFMQIRDYRLTNQYINYLDLFRNYSSLKSIPLNQRYDQIYDLFMQESSGLLISQKEVINQILDKNLKIIEDSLSVKSIQDNQEETKQQNLNGSALNPTTLQAIAQICICIKLLKDVESKYPNLSKTINDDEDDVAIIEKLKIKLKIMANTDDIGKVDKSNVNVIERFKMYKSMREIDKLIDSQIFIPAYQFCDNLINHDPHEVQQKAIIMFEKRQYDELKLLIEEKQKGGEKLVELKQIADKIIDYLKKQSLDQENTIKMIKFIYHKPNMLSSQQVQELGQCTSILINIKQYYQIYVGKQDIDQTIQSVFIFLQTNFEQQFQNSLDDTTENKFYEANKSHNLVEEMITILKLTLLPQCASNNDVTIKLREYTEELDKNRQCLLKQIVILFDKYCTVKIFHYPSLKPEEVIQNLQKINDNKLISRTVDNMMNLMKINFQKQYKDLLIEIFTYKKPEGRENRNNLIEEIKYSLGFMFKEIRLEIETKIDFEIKRDIDFINVVTERLKNIIDSSDGNIKNIVDHLLQYKIEDQSHKILIQDYINKRFNKLCAQTTDCIKKYEAKNAILLIEEAWHSYFKVYKSEEKKQTQEPILRRQLSRQSNEQNQSKQLKTNGQINDKCLNKEKEIKLSQFFTQEQHTIFTQVMKDLNSMLEKIKKYFIQYFTENQVKYIFTLSRDSINPPGINDAALVTTQKDDKRPKNIKTGKIIQNIIQSIIDFHQFSNISRELKDQIPTPDKMIDELIQLSFNYLDSLKKQFDLAYSHKAITDVIHVISNLKNTEKIRKSYIDMLNQLKLAQPENRNKLLQLDKSFNYNSVHNIIMQWVTEIENNITVQFINPETQGNQKEISDFYKKIQKNLSALKDFQQVYKISDATNTYVDDQIFSIESILSAQIHQIGIHMNDKDQAKLRDYYINFKTINDVLTQKRFSLHLQSRLDKFNQLIQSKIDLIRQNGIQECTEKEINTQTVSLNLICLMSFEIPEFKIQFEEAISKILEDFSNKTSDNPLTLTDLALSLQKKPRGRVLVEKHPIFEGFNICDANKRFQSMKVEHLLHDLKGDNLNTHDLLLYYQKYQTKYEEILTQALTPIYDEITRKRLPPSSDFLIHQIKANYSDLSAQKWTNYESRKLPELIAYILCLWTIINSSAYQKLSETSNEGKQTRQYLKQPHVGQIITIFRILGLGYSQNQGLFSQMKSGVADAIFGKGSSRQIMDNLVQLKTGEGKSIILAVVSIVFALHGFEVRTVCYSQILSERDYNAFLKLFELLGISKSIKYGTFKSICEEQINKEGSIREIVVSHILKDAPVAHIDRKKSKKPTVLMIDEVDVFFSKDFYGNTYSPQAIIQNPSVIALLDLVWSMRKQKINLMFKDVIKSKEYADCFKIFKAQYAFIIEEAIKDMVYCASNIDIHAYEVQDGKIGYVDIDEISFNLNKGYSTTFAYYKEHENKMISTDKLNENKVIGVNCGSFSYAEVPKDFQIILGVTGTLEYLSDSERYIIQHIYNIKLNTFIPSVFGNQLLQENNIIIEDKKVFYSKIVNDCKQQLKDDFSRAVIIFFENQENLNNFYNSAQFVLYKNKCLRLTETVTAYEKEVLIQKATYSGQVTLSTATFGRGTDFVSRDPKVNESGGIHIIQTFYSKALSEEIQIKGRTSRQGENGSYSLILNNEQLKDFCIEQEDINNATNTMDKKEMLSRFRKVKQQQENTNNTMNIKEDLIQHKRSYLNLNLVKSIIEGKKQENQELYQFFKELNIGRPIFSATKTLVLIDATGSMGNMLQKTKAAVVIMFERAKEILTENQMDPNLFMMQIACYRNYSSGIKNILQNSSWESNAGNLQQYMQNISNSGGQGNEAVEIGLQHANNEIISNAESPLSQIFIIGDAIPNTQAEVTSKREGTSWANSIYAKPTHYQTELIKIKEAGIPVFTFYVANNDNLKTSFGEIACNGGTCQYLDIDNEKRGQKDLIDFFTKQILQRIGDLNGGNGSKLVNCYIEKMPTYR